MSTPESGPTGPQPAESQRAFYRSTKQRLLGGVAGGVSEWLGIPVWLVRAAFILLALPIVGIVVYLALWILIPVEGSSPQAGSLQQRTLLLRVLIAFVVLIFAVPLISGISFNSNMLMPLLLVVIGLSILMRGDRNAMGPTSNDERSATGIAATTEGDSAVAVSQRQRHVFQFPVVGLGTWSIVLLVIGSAALAVALGAGPPAPGVLAALTLMIISGGLIFSAFRGRARGLILPAAGLMVVLGLMGALNIRIDRVEGPFDASPTDSTTLDEEYVSTVGYSTLDLSGLRLDSNQHVRVRVEVGTLRLILPSETTTKLDARTAYGPIGVLRPSRADIALADTTVALKWLDGTIPSAGESVDAEILDVFRSRGLMGGIGTQTSETSGAHLRKTFDQGSDHVLSIDASIGLGNIEVIDPHWSDESVSLAKPAQLCTVGGGPRGVVEACDSVPAEKRVALCLNDNGYLVDCREDRPGSVDNPRVAACSDFTSQYVNCAEVSVEVTGAQLLSPGGSGEPEEPTPEWSTSPTTTITPTDNTIAMPDSSVLGGS